jgi:PAS domain S-box-containing protein
MNDFKKSPDEQVALLVSLLANSNEIIIQVDDKGIIRFINRVTVGLRYEDVIGTFWLSYVPEDHRVFLDEHFQKTLKTGEISECEAIGPGENGARIWYWKRFFPLRKGKEIVGVVFISRDITDKKQMQIKLEHQQMLIHNFFNRAPVLICMLSGKDFTFQMANQEYQRMVGNRDIIGKPLREVIPLIDEKLFSHLNDVFETNQSFLGKDMPFISDWDGGSQPQLKYFTFLFEPVPDSTGSVESIWVVGIDVTESKRMEASMQLNDRLVSLGTLAAGIGHEINNPLAYSILNLDILQTELQEIVGLQNKTKIDLLNQKIEIAHLGLQRVAEIVKSLKAFSHAADVAEVNKIELHECIEGALEIGTNIIKQRARVKKDFQYPMFIQGNLTKMVQVFLNLLVNAAQSMEEENFNTNVITIQTRSDENGVQVKLSDTGMGISPENLNKIFDPFFTTKEVGEGSGLGLHICHGIIISMGGTVCFESQMGIGTTVNLTFHRSN